VQCLSFFFHRQDSFNSMKLKKLIPLSASVLVLTGLYLPTLVLPAAAQVQIAQAQPRIRIAVLDFEYASTGQTWAWWGGIAPSQGVSDLLTNKLVDGGAYTLIERSRIQAVLQEQNLGASGRIDASTAAQVGRILGADAVVMGSITRYNVNEGSSGMSILGVGSNRRRVTADVQLTARLVNTTTSEIIATAEGQGEAQQRSGGLSIGGLFSQGSSNNNTDELISNAAQAAVEQLSGVLTSKASEMGGATSGVPSVSALVADVAGSSVIINKGSSDGFRVGMTLSIERVTREVKDPATGQVIRTVTSPVGQIELTSVDGRSSEGRVVSGNGMQIGDRAIAVE
jgi:curli biogenesis system outer membrane secretion channel CsgG